MLGGGFWRGLSDLIPLPLPTGIQHDLADFADRLLDRTLRLAVTGLRGGGKTVFITTMVHHLLTGRALPFLTAAREGRLLGARLLERRPGDLPAFPFAAARAALAAPEPRWPAPTEALSALRLEIRFTITGTLRRQLGERRSLILEIIDYPGEWLLDLPLLALDYPGWSSVALEAAKHPSRAGPAQEFLQFLTTLELGAPAKAEQVVRAAELYTALLRRCQTEVGLSVLQPGRFTMPGELAGSDLLCFCPLPPGEAPRGSLRALMAARYEGYLREVVRPFYHDHFVGFDRQIVLVDLLGALNRGPECFHDTEAALAMVLESFRYGGRSLLGRLFQPRIDGLLFAVSKADHVAHNQHHNLRLLLERLVAEAAGQARFEGVRPAFIALAALRATEVVRTEHHGQVLSCVRGRLKGEARETVLFPGEIPPDLPAEEDWRADRFRFRDFAPRPLDLHGGSDRPQHIRLDQALDILLGDRLR
jgi:predicted YcjX-like family ATPase